MCILYLLVADRDLDVEGPDVDLHVLRRASSRRLSRHRLDRNSG